MARARCYLFENKVDVGVTQVAAGFADAVRTYDYSAQQRLTRLDKKATRQALGYHGTCA